MLIVKSILRSIVFWWCLCLWHSQMGGLFAQLPAYHIQNFDSDSGIRPGSILALAQDSRGFLWLMGQRMVQCFDGKTTRNYPLHTYPIRLFCDDQGGVWISTHDQILRFSAQKGRFVSTTLPPVDSLGMVIGVFQLPDHSIWALSIKGLFAWQPKQQSFQRVKMETPPPYIPDMLLTRGWQLYFHQGRNVHAYNFQTKTLRSLPDQGQFRLFPLNDDQALQSNWDNETWFLDFAKKTVTKLELPLGLRESPQASNLHTRGLTAIGPDQFYLSAREGNFIYTPKTGQLKPITFNMAGMEVKSKDFVNTVFDDGHGTSWIASPGGLLKIDFKNPRMGLLRAPKERPDATHARLNSIRRMVEDHQGRLWLATGHGLACYEQNKADWFFIPPLQGKPNYPAHPSLISMVYDGKNLLIGAAGMGLWLMNTDTRQFQRPKYGHDSIRLASEADFFDDIITLRNGDHLLMGRDFLYAIEGGNYTLRVVKTLPKQENTNYAWQGPDGLIWLATVKGLYCLDEKFKILARQMNASIDDLLTAGYMRKDGQLLFCSLKGLFLAKFENGQIRLQKQGFFFENQMNTILHQDELGAIWAAGDDGIVRLDGQTKRLQKFDHSDNLQGYAFNAKSVLCNSAGQVLVGGNNGINYFDPKDFDSETACLDIFFQRINIDGIDSLYQPSEQVIKLKPGDHYLLLEYAVPFFNNPDKISYRYKLEGIENTWRSLGRERILQINRLPIGQYRLQLQASLNEQDWTSSKDHLIFKVAAPLWQRPWVIVILLGILALGILWYVRLRNRQVRAKEEELEAEQAINYFASSIYSQSTVDAILWDVARNCIGRLQFEDCVVYLLDEKRNVLVQKAAHGPKSPRHYEIMQPLEISLGQGIVGSVAASGSAEIVPDTRKDPRYIVDDAERLSEISVPIVFDGKVLGVIDCEHSALNFFTSKHHSVLTTIASLCANKIVRAKAEEEKELAKQSLVDARQRMREVEMQALRAQMNPHFIFNCLNSINRYIVKSDQATASLYLTRFAKLIRLILDNSNSENVVLTNELEALKLYIEMESLRFAEKFNWQVKVEEGVNLDTIEVPPMIIQPFVENAIWHGLLHLEKPGSLLVKVSLNSHNMLECVIEDNGIGREKARELKSKTATTRKSLGMRLTEDRLTLLNQNAQLNAGIRIEDLKDEQGQACGTRVTLQIPI
jgi:ligand-binding sensor domain-containing protein/putative methionine-R-sulfoxide reductase with GAF domain